jgi:Ca2+-binding EF-hand superfamily protein
LLFVQEVSDDYLDEMMNQAPGAINFTMFLTLFGERLQGTDPEDVIRNAFACFDDANCGTRVRDACVRPLIAHV